MTGPNVPMLNDNALSNISVDVDFLEAEFKRIGREHVNVAFSELRSVSCIYFLHRTSSYLQLWLLAIEHYIG